MRLADFIDANLEPILVEWVAFARTKLPQAKAMTELSLRDDAADMLKEIADGMRLFHDDEERAAKSQGLLPRDPTLGPSPSRAHAMQRRRSGFEVNQMVSEFRALRSTVLRLWRAAGVDGTDEALEDVMRFNEAVDELLADSMRFFVAEVDRARNLFLGVVGHDLRTPLGTITSCAHYQLRTQPERARETNMILRAAMNMKGLLDDLLAYTRDRLGVGLSIEPGWVELDSFARQTLEEIRTVNPHRTIEFETQGDVAGPWDARRLHQVLSNLVVNAIKYGAPERPIRVALDGRQGHQVLLAVHNFGPAIAPTLLQDLFEPLVRGRLHEADTQMSGANMGLGLHIAREVVAAHGGTITVRSSADEGTRFEVMLPRGVAQDEADALAEPSAPA